jgi:hypothetical protein
MARGHRSYPAALLNGVLRGTVGIESHPRGTSEMALTRLTPDHRRLSRQTARVKDDGENALQGGSLCASR